MGIQQIILFTYLGHSIFHVSKILVIITFLAKLSIKRLNGFLVILFCLSKALSNWQNKVFLEANSFHVSPKVWFSVSIASIV